MKSKGRLLGRALAALAAVTLASLGVAAPAYAAPVAERPGATCWLDADTGSIQCFESHDAWVQALADRGIRVIAQAGPVSDEKAANDALADQSAATSESFGTLAVYLLASLYEDINYGGNELAITTGNSWYCSGTDYNGNMPSGWNDRVSSFQSYGGCRTRLASNINQSGPFYGPVTSASSLGSFNDIASSYRVLD